MLDWRGYLRSVAGTEKWPFVAADLFLHQEREPAPIPPARFLEDVFADLADVARSERLIAHRGALALSVQLLGHEVDAFMPQMISLVRSWNDLAPEDLDPFAEAYRPYRLEDRFRRDVTSTVDAAPSAETASTKDTSHVSSRKKRRTRQQRLCVFVVPLAEEFRAISKAVPGLKPKSDRSGRAYYEILNEQTAVTCRFLVLGRAGNTWSAAVTSKILDSWRPQVMFEVGICGGIDGETKLGDVVIATEMDEYLASAKAVPDGEGGTRFELAGSVFKSDQLLADTLAQLEFRSPDWFSNWCYQQASFVDERVPTDRLGELRAMGLVLSQPLVHDGPLASGPIVGASEEFVKWLLDRNRKYVAIEMEAAGAAAAVAVDYGRSTRFCVIRGVSDFGDARKQELDRIGKQGLREIAARAAITYALGVLPELPESAWK